VSAGQYCAARSGITLASDTSSVLHLPKTSVNQSNVLKVVPDIQVTVFILLPYATSAPTLSTFRRRLKNYLFSLSFSEDILDR